MSEPVSGKNTPPRQNADYVRRLEHECSEAEALIGLLRMVARGRPEGSEVYRPYVKYRRAKLARMDSARTHNDGSGASGVSGEDEQ